MNEEKDLELWFGLSYAGWLTIPRVLTKQMPKEWQIKMAGLLNEFDDTFPNQPDIGTRVVLTDNGRFTKKCNWLHNYRFPDFEEIDKIKVSEV